MKTIKKALRLLFMVLLLMMAAFGIGLTGNFLNGNKERYRDNEIRTEQSAKRKDVDEETPEFKE
jgi:hypothetical protein